MEKPKCPSTDEWIKKMWCVCVCSVLNEILVIKKNEIVPFAAHGWT